MVTDLIEMNHWYFEFDMTTYQRQQNRSRSTGAVRRNTDCEELIFEGFFTSRSEAQEYFSLYDQFIARSGLCSVE